MFPNVEPTDPFGGRQQGHCKRALRCASCLPCVAGQVQYEHVQQLIATDLVEGAELHCVEATASCTVPRLGCLLAGRQKVCRFALSTKEFPLCTAILSRRRVRSIRAPLVARPLLSAPVALNAGVVWHGWSHCLTLCFFRPVIFYWVTHLRPSRFPAFESAHL